jgi:hypothetical protein
LPDMTTVASGHPPPAGLAPAGTAASIAAALHRSGRAVCPHPALASGDDAKAA